MRRKCIFLDIGPIILHLWSIIFKNLICLIIIESTGKDIYRN